MCDIKVDYKTHQTLIFSTFVLCFGAFVQMQFFFADKSDNFNQLVA